MNPVVIAETDEYLVINKPAGLVTHPSGKTDGYSVSQWFGEHYPDSLDVGEPLVTTIGGEIVEIPRPGIVHRLDKETSGVMVLAKTPEFFEYIKGQFGSRKVQKTYLALVCGIPRQERGIIDEPIGREKGGVERMATGSRIRGVSREAQTTYMISGKGSFEGKKYALLQCVPKTGRTHQIRIHMNYIGHPLVSDALYGPKIQPEGDSRIISRMALHAWKLAFTDAKGKNHAFSVPPPQDFLEALDTLDIPLLPW